MTAAAAQTAGLPAFRRNVGDRDHCWWVTIARSVNRLPLLPAAAVSSSPTDDGIYALSPPAGTFETNRVWLKPGGIKEGSFGCASHRGPTTNDKENEDFAFALSLPDDRGDDWVVAGVCDGVTQSPWSERGARHAAVSFIELVTEELAHPQDLASTIQEPAKKQEFAERFQSRLMKRLELDGERLQAARIVDPKFSESVYRNGFLECPGALRREAWFQTTILATALGPRGGFVLLMGDGYARLDRTRADGSIHSKDVDLQSDPGKPERFVSTALEAKDVLTSIRGISPDGARKIGVVLATDGVSKSPNHGLESARLAAATDCQLFLERLSQRKEPERVESDNMSVAFATREVAQ